MTALRLVGRRLQCVVSQLPSTGAQQYARRNSGLSTVPVLAVACRASQVAVLRFAWPTQLQSRAFSRSSAVSHGHVDPPKPGEELYITFVDKDGTETKIAVSAGENLLDIAQAHDIEMEGACGGSCACSTCHVIVTDPEFYDKMPEPDDDENDMLDLAFGLTETSRLGCQVKMTKELDGLRVNLPMMTRNIQAKDLK